MLPLFNLSSYDVNTDTFKKMLDFIYSKNISDIFDYNLVDRSNIIMKIV